MTWVSSSIRKAEGFRVRMSRVLRVQGVGLREAEMVLRCEMIERRNEADGLNLLLTA